MGYERNAMTTKNPATLLRESLIPGDPLSLDEAVRVSGAPRDATILALNHLVSRGDLLKVRQRLWVRAGAAVDPYRLAARISEPYAFVYGSALALNGAGPAERSEVLVSSPHRFTAFEFAGISFRWVRPWIAEGLVRVSAGPEFVWASRPERTLVDCVRVPANAGGIEELARAIDMLLGLDPDEVVRWVDRYQEAALAARLGFLLEASGVYPPRSPLVRALLKRRSEHLVYLSERRSGGRLIARWNLIVPPHFAQPPG
jgi:predicted transcriptional regulator of viral defense system